ncbi:MAG: hypothetical protein AAGD23_10395 [Pseudomonadota bacterium]
MRFGHTRLGDDWIGRGKSTSLAVITITAGLVAGCSLPGGNLLNRSAPLTTSSTSPSNIEAPHLMSFVGERAWPSLRSAVITALHGSEDGERVMWKSSRAGVTGTVTPISTVTGGDGRRCRRISITAATEDDADEILSEACPVGIKGWRISPL